MHANSATHTCRLVLNYTEAVISNVHEADAYPYTVAIPPSAACGHAVDNEVIGY